MDDRDLGRRLLAHGHVRGREEAVLQHLHTMKISRRLARLIVCGYRTTHRRAAAVHHAVNVARRHVHGCAAVHLLHGRLRLLQLLLLLRLLQVLDDRLATVLRPRRAMGTVSLTRINR